MPAVGTHSSLSYWVFCLLYSAHLFFCAALILFRAAADNLRFAVPLGAWLAGEAEPILWRISAIAFSISAIWL